MEDLSNFIIGEISDPTLMNEFVVMVRILVFSLVVEGIGVYISHISKLGR